MRTKVKRITALVLSFALCLTGFSFGTKAYATVTAGASSVLAQNLLVNQDEVDKLVEEERKANLPGVAEDGSFCGFYNLGIAIPDEGNLNVREEPASDGHIVGKMGYGAGCEIIDEVDGWYQITSNDVSGYVSADYIATGDAAMEIAQDEVAYIATVTENGLRVRSEATTDSEILYTIASGEKLEVVKEDGDWIMVLVNNYEYAYVSSEFVTLAYEIPFARTMTQVRYGEGVSELRAALCDYALSAVGYSYVWGGTSLKGGCDCSGLVLRCYQDIAGISLVHSSRAQANYGTRISASQAQPGDLFFYGSGSYIDHVAIYIGGGMIVQAHSARVGIITSSAYFRTPVCVVSILP